MRFESENVEFKSQMLDDLYKEVIAFANTDGGVIYVGLDDQGNITGIDNIDETYTRITNGIRDAIQPDVTIFVRYVLQENKVIRIEINEGSYKPYYLKAFESMRSVHQELTFKEATEAFERYKVDFSEDKYIALGMRNIHDDQYTNLAWILSDQCQHTTKVAVFGDKENTVFKDAKEFYPKEALREALLNALVHRDYSFSGSIIINVNDSCIEFISIEGLLPGLSADDIRNGISQPRNRSLAEIFHRLRLIESYGTGIRRIYSLYRNCRILPQIEVTPNTFKLILPNMNYSVEEDGKLVEATEKKTCKITAQMKTVLDYLNEYGEINEDDLQELLSIKRTRAYLLARQMNEAGLIEIVGRGADKKYKLAKK